MVKELMDIIYSLIVGLNDTDEIAIYKAAIKLNRFDVIELLISKKFNLNTSIQLSPYDEIDILCDAFMHGKIEMVNFLIENGATIVQKRSIENIFQTKSKEIQFIECLLKMDFDNDLTNTIIAWLFMENNNIPMIEKILDKGYNIVDNSKYLHVKLAKSNVQTVKFFINNGLVLDSSYPLLFACHSSNLPLIEFYLDYGLQVNQEILDYVLLKKINILIIRLFVKYSVDFSSVRCENSDDDLIYGLEKNGMSKNVIINILANHISQYNTTSYLSLKEDAEIQKKYLNG